MQRARRGISQQRMLTQLLDAKTAECDAKDQLLADQREELDGMHARLVELEATTGMAGEPDAAASES